MGEVVRARRRRLVSNRRVVVEQISGQRLVLALFLLASHSASALRALARRLPRRPLSVLEPCHLCQAGELVAVDPVDPSAADSGCEDREGLGASEVRMAQVAGRSLAQETSLAEAVRMVACQMRRVVLGKVRVLQGSHLGDQNGY